MTSRGVALVLSAIGVAALTACNPTTSARGSNDATNAPADAQELKSAKLDLTLPAGPLTAGNLKAWALSKKQFVPADQYTKPFDDSSLFGRNFRIQFKEGVENGPLTSRYDADAGELIIDLDLTLAITANYGSNTVRFIPIYRENSALGSEPMSNAFGVTKDVQSARSLEVGVGNIDAKLGLSPSHTYTSLMPDFAYRLKVTPDLARASENSRTAVISGVIGKGESGHTIECYSFTQEATLSDPNRETKESCVVFSRLTGVIIKDRDGSIIKQWGVAHE